MTQLPAISSPATPEDSSWVEIGTIVAPQGIKGEVRVYPDTDFPERFEVPGQRWLLRSGQTQPDPVELLQGRYLSGKKLYVVKLAGIRDREQAEALRGAKLVVPQSDRPPLAEDEFHLMDLIGLEVWHQQTQTVIGSVVGIVTAGNDLLEVALNSEGNLNILIPLVREIVPVVDLEQGRVEITPPAGLLPQ